MSNTVDQIVTDEALFTYVVASADMRYIEINSREIHLRHAPDLGFVVRGEMPGCGPDCYVGLGQIFLEYATSCEGCRDSLVAEASAAQFGVRLGRLLAERLCPETAGLAGIGQVAALMECLLNSMNVPFASEHIADHKASRLRYVLAHCPFHAAAQDTGLSRGVAVAHRAFAALAKTALRVLAPDWTLVRPSERGTEEPLLEIILARS